MLDYKRVLIRIADVVHIEFHIILRSERVVFSESCLDLDSDIIVRDFVIGGNLTLDFVVITAKVRNCAFVLCFELFSRKFLIRLLFIIDGCSLLLLDSDRLALLIAVHIKVRDHGIFRIN